MAWAEEQDWFGLEDLVIEKLEEDEYNLIHKIWVTRDKVEIPINKMETSHIKNCIKCIEKSNFKWRPEYYKLLKQELTRRLCTQNKN